MTFPNPKDNSRPEGSTWEYLSDAEWYCIFVRRAMQLTGQYLHTTDDGLYYLWKMGDQTHPPALDQVTIHEAVDAYLAWYEPQDQSAWNAQFTTPIPK